MTILSFFLICSFDTSRRDWEKQAQLNASTIQNLESEVCARFFVTDVCGLDSRHLWFSLPFRFQACKLPTDRNSQECGKRCNTQSPEFSQTRPLLQLIIKDAYMYSHTIVLPSYQSYSSSPHINQGLLIAAPTMALHQTPLCSQHRQ